MSPGGQGPPASALGGPHQPRVPQARVTASTFHRVQVQVTDRKRQHRRDNQPATDRDPGVVTLEIGLTWRRRGLASAAGGGAQC